jgi:hypothetical protein
MLRTMIEDNWLIVPKKYAREGAPSYHMTGHPAWPTREAAESYLDSEIKRLKDIIPKTGDGADYLACRIGTLMTMCVIHRSELRQREAREGLAS